MEFFQRSKVKSDSNNSCHFSGKYKRKIFPLRKYNVPYLIIRGMITTNVIIIAVRSSLYFRNTRFHILAPIVPRSMLEYLTSCLPLKLVLVIANFGGFYCTLSSLWFLSPLAVISIYFTLDVLRELR